ncbi:MAG: hypothetical protein K6F22_02595 [Prevotella sp.]|nr:hypothetical protein [Prevotella sp.]
MKLFSALLLSIIVGILHAKTTDLLYLFSNKAIDGTGLMSAQTFNFRVIRK